MKNTVSLLSCLILLFIVFTSEKCVNDNEEKQPEQSPHSITITVKSYSTDMPLGQVDVIMQNGGVTTPISTTAADGRVTLPNVVAQNEYIFSKQGFLSQQIFFTDYSAIESGSIYMKNTSTESMQTNLWGITYGSNGQPASNVRVTNIGNGQSTNSDGNGRYSMDVPRESGYQLRYSQNITEGAVHLIVDQDTVEFDVTIDGFTVDTLTQVKEGIQN